MTKERKNVTWRVAEHPEHKKLNQWLDSQRNIQDSISNIVLHMIDRYGYVNITDYQIQKLLYGKITDVGYVPEIDNELVESEVEVEAEGKVEVNTVPEEKTQKEDEENSVDDVYSQIDKNNL